MLIEKKKQRCLITADIAVPVDANFIEQEIEKIEKYNDLKREIGKIPPMRSVNVVPAGCTWLYDKNV